jgi:hypothetical protein
MRLQESAWPAPPGREKGAKRAHWQVGQKEFYRTFIKSSITDL